MIPHDSQREGKKNLVQSLADDIQHGSRYVVIMWQESNSMCCSKINKEQNEGMDRVSEITIRVHTALKS